ncbi:MAG: radical SAM family heme chaperone HemW [Flammeovirgaceae bacterium]|nr:radical SAM family heme chaperone HemW [Flammeovirgaceae bacterium]
MAGLYIHIPFCKQACHYCDFHFSTNTQLMADLVKAIIEEIHLQKNYLNQEIIQTIYFGGGTPSLVPASQLHEILAMIQKQHTIADDVEITLEANPDDLTATNLSELKKLGVNRLSIGIQSWNTTLLTFMNRAHNAAQSQRAIDLAREAGFLNINLDLIYGVPGQTLNVLQNDLEVLIRNSPEHISTYSLTIESKTVFDHWRRKGKFAESTEESVARQYQLIMESLSQAGFLHYEISNFAKPGFESKHNSSYWSGSKYLGVGPSAHSYDGLSRQFNVLNNYTYVKSISEKTIPFEKEILSDKDHINEYIFTSLRTHRGCDFNKVQQKFNHDLLSQNRDYLLQLEKNQLVTFSDNLLKLTNQGKLLADKITSDLFVS